MRKLKFGFLLLAVFAAGTGAFIVSGVISDDEPGIHKAPLREEFLELYRDLGRAVIQGFTESGYPLGFLPGPRDLSYFRYLPQPEIQALPAYYDLRNKNRLTSVKDQGGCGSCWAFATYTSLESFLMPGKQWDFSEQNLIDNHGLDWGPCEGGNIDISAAYLTRWDGPVNEVDDPYEYDSIVGAPIKKLVQEIIYIPPRSGSLNNNLIKRAVRDYGALYASMAWKDSRYNSANYAFYGPSNETNNHAVSIVGWNDNFSRNKFNDTPPGDGAFIVKNSWGTNWGDSGYFYISYYDQNFCRGYYSAAVTAENKTKYFRVYQYDDLGWTTSFGFGSEIAWFANIFTSNSNIPLTAVSFYTAATENNYEIFIYKDVISGIPRSGTRVLTQTGQIGSPGYFTVELDHPVNLSKNKRFSVVVKLRTRGYDYPIPAEYPFSGYSSGARAQAGQSFISANGSGWHDFHKVSGGAYANTNVCLKAFTGYPPQELTITAGQGGTTKPPPGTHTFDWNVTLAVEALPHNTYIFDHWSGDLTGSENPETITMDSDKSVKAHFRLIHPPANASVQQIANRSLFQEEYINVLKWESNPGNNGINIAKYRIYEMDGNTGNLLVELNADTFEYWHRKVDENTSYWYALAAVTAGGREGKPVYLTVQ